MLVVIKFLPRQLIMCVIIESSLNGSRDHSISLPRTGRRLNHWHAIRGRCLNFVRESWSGSVDGRIVDLGIADHANEEGPFLSEGLLLLLVLDLCQLIVVVLEGGNKSHSLVGAIKADTWHVSPSPRFQRQSL